MDQQLTTMKKKSFYFNYMYFIFISQYFILKIPHFLLGINPSINLQSIAQLIYCKVLFTIGQKNHFGKTAPKKNVIIKYIIQYIHISNCGVTK